MPISRTPFVRRRDSHPGRSSGDGRSADRQEAGCTANRAERKHEIKTASSGRRAVADPEEATPPLAPSVAPPVEGWTCPSGRATDTSWETGAANPDRSWTAGPATRAAEASA